MPRSSDALAQNVNWAGRAHQQLEATRLFLRVRSIVSNQMKAPRMNLVVELHTSLVAAGELLWNPGIPKIIHVEAHHALPVDTGLTGQRLKEGHLAFPGGEDHPDLFLPFQ